MENERKGLGKGIIMQREYYYDCQVCGKKHITKSAWTKETEQDLNQWSLNIEDELLDGIVASVKENFKKLHPDAEYIEERFHVGELNQIGEINYCRL